MAKKLYKDKLIKELKNGAIQENKSLKEMQDNGELDKLIKKWFADEK